MASTEEYSRSVLRVSVAQICQNLGWNATQTSPLELLTDVLERYLQEIAKISHRYSEQFGRTQPNLDDLGLTFRHMGINLGELEDYVRHVDPVPFAHEVVSFPAPKTSNLQFPNANSREILQHREEHIHEHLPHMFPGMEDEAVPEREPIPALTSQAPAQENTTAEVKSPVVGEKRPQPNSAEGPPPSKRARVTASNLPEEAAHSQYEMTSITISPGGFLTPTRGRGRLPDSRTPPPTIRHALTFADPTPVPASKGMDGSEANKENTAVELAPKEPPVRISLSTGKDGATVVSKPESSKPKGRKEGKLGLKEKAKKPKKTDMKSKKSGLGGKKGEAKIKVVVAASKTTASVTLEEPKDETPPSKKPKAKEGKVKEGKVKAGKPPRSEKSKEKATAKKKQSVSTTLPSMVASESGTESRLKDLLLSHDKYKLDDIVHPGPSTSKSPRKELDFDFVHSPDTDLTLRQAFPPTDIFDNSSQERSPQRLVIAEAEGRAQEREEEKRIRLKNIDDTISAVVRDSASLSVREELKSSSENPVQVPVSTPTPSPKKRGRPKKVKPKVKSSEFIDEEVIKREAEDEMGARSAQSINDTINAVISQGADNSQPSAPEKNKSAEPASVPPTPTTEKEGKKEGKKKKKLDKTKSPGVKKKLKDKLQGKGEKAESSSPPPLSADIKPFVSDKFSNAEMKVFEFGETDSPPPIPARRPSQAERETPPPPVPSTPPTSQGSFSPVEIKPIIKSPTPETALIVSSASTSSTPSQDHTPSLTLKIGIPKDQDKHRERSKDKDHKKDKKEKRRDKEKKKKNKDKDRDRDREHKHHHEHKHEKNKKKEETTTAEGSGFKIKIKLGSKPAETSSVMTVTEDKPLTESVIKHEVSSPSQRPEILKLVIRRDATEGGSSQKKKHSSKVQKSASVIKPEPRNTPPTLHPASPLPATPPPPVLSRNNSPVAARSPSPVRVKAENGRGRSPTRKSSPRHEVFSFTSPRSSPPRGRPSVTPPPRTPSPSHPKSPSPMPRTPSPRRHPLANSPLSISSPLHRSPSAGRKSPTPTPKTPSLSPAYPPPSPVHSDHSPTRGRSPGPSKPLFKDRSPSPKKPVAGRRSPSPMKPLFGDQSPEALKPLFGTPERETSPPPSPLFQETPVEVKPEVKAESSPPPILPKPKGKVGRPRSKSPRTTSPKGKSPKVPKSPKGFGKTIKSPKAGTGKSPGRGRPPKAKTLALRAALAAAAAAGEDTPQATPAKPKGKPPPPAPLEIKTEEMPTLSPPALEVEKSGLNSSSESPSPTNLSIAFDASPSTTRQRGTVEAETVGSFFDATTGQQIWICPSCKLQDDGSPMIGCDKCDDWYHWVCVGINREPPEEESWYCPRCKSKLKQDKPKAKRGRKKKNP